MNQESVANLLPAAGTQGLPGLTASCLVVEDVAVRFEIKARPHVFVDEKGRHRLLPKGNCIDITAGR